MVSLELCTALPLRAVNITDNLNSALWALWNRKRDGETHLRADTEEIPQELEAWTSASEGFHFSLVGAGNILFLVFQIKTY
jgi:hypothetical protein